MIWDDSRLVLKEAVRLVLSLEMSIRVISAKDTGPGWSMSAANCPSHSADQGGAPIGWSYIRALSARPFSSATLLNLSQLPSIQPTLGLPATRLSYSTYHYFSLSFFHAFHTIQLLLYVQEATRRVAIVFSTDHGVQG